MIDFISVSREIRSLLSRRRELLTFLGSAFAALGIFLQNVLRGDLPESLRGLTGHVFATYALLLLVPSLLLALRLAKLNAGMTLNGILYARLMQAQEFTTRPGPEALRAAGRVNVFGVSFLMFLLAALLAGFAAALLELAVNAVPATFVEAVARPLGVSPFAVSAWMAALVGAAVALAVLLLYLRFHRQAVSFALFKSAHDACAPFEREPWEAHQAESLREANHDMITLLALVGLIVFSAFEGLSGLGHATARADLPSEQVQQFGPLAYGLLMTVTCFLGLVTYVRLRLAVGVRSLQLDPTDRPFRPLRLTDSLLGYMLLAFLFVVSLHFLLYPYLPGRPLLLADAAAFGAALLAEQLSLVIAGRRYHKP
jgi:hypothetical protein